jgi:uncharacterized cupredoxin-like copper-binding protein
MARRRLVALLALAGLIVFGAAACSDARADQARIAIHYSRFEPALLEVPAGQPVTITLRNDDPIDHEWMVGSPEVHERHRTGTEPVHDSIPTEVTVPALETRVTTVQFDEPGDYAYICHLPGHEAYGMVGVVRVVGE